MSKVRLVSQVAAGALGGSGVIALTLGLVFPHEGRELVAYLDPLSIPTICDGVTHGVRLGDTASDAECDARTIAAVKDAIATVRRCAPGVTFKDHQLAAWASFTYNVGPGKTGPNGKDGFCILKSGKKPTLLKHLLAGNHTAACEELPKWTLGGGIRWPGLVKRRAAERAMCLGIAP
jgi:lysozyme